MKTCTGEQYNGQFQQYACIDNWHGKFGHLNILKLDHDDICTHYGKHDRIVTSLPQYADEVEEIAVYVRIDNVWNLGMPSERDINDVIRKHDGTKGKWTITKTIQEQKCTHIWLTSYKAS